MKLSELAGDHAAIARISDPQGQVSWAVRNGAAWYAVNATLSDLCAEGVAAARERLEGASTQIPLDADQLTLLVPADPAQEIWAAGVTYERSRTARIAESGAHNLYTAVYESDRPELFFKAPGRRAVGSDQAIGVRADATWSVPEPELAVVFDVAGATFGFTIGDDVSSRDIEASNALYLPQAKVYDRSCAIGPAIVPAWAIAEEPVFEIELEITRAGEMIFSGGTATTQLRRHWEELGRWLRACLTFPEGVVLLTGTGIVPNDDVSLAADDVVTVRISGLGQLTNRVQTSGAEVLA